MRLIILVYLLMVLGSCTSKEEIIADLRSNNADRIIKACAKLEDADDSEFVPLLLENPYDRRETFILKYKGRTVYQQKMAALSRISGMPPPHQLTYEVDSAIVRFYQDWARNEGYIK